MEETGAYIGRAIPGRSGMYICLLHVLLIKHVLKERGSNESPLIVAVIAITIKLYSRNH